MRKTLFLSLGVFALAVCLVQPVRAQTGATRPQGYSTGLGAGWSFPQDVLTPNTVSARFRLKGGLTIEPLVTISYGRTSSGVTGLEDDVVNVLTFGAGALARIPVAGRDKVDLQLLVGGGIAYVSSKDNPVGPDNTIDTTAIGLDALWGLSVEYFVTHHWSWSFDAINPLIAYLSTTRSLPGGVELTSNTLQVGAIFAPTIRLMTHIYF